MQKLLFAVAILAGLYLALGDNSRFGSSGLRSSGGGGAGVSDYANAPGRALGGLTGN